MFEDLIHEKLIEIHNYLRRTYRLDCDPHIIWFDDTDTLMVTITINGVHARTKIRGYADELAKGMTTEQVCKVLRGRLSNNLYLHWRQGIYTEEALESLPS